MASPHVEQPHARSRRRWRWLALAILPLAAGVVAAMWWGYLPHHRPGLQAGERYGLDVSNHQGVIDWDRVADDGIAFTYIKATEGGDFVDKSFARNWKEAAAADLDVGAYHFFTLCRTGEEQAANFLQVVPQADADLLPALDLEFPGNCAARPSTDWVHTEVESWIERVEEATGQSVLLYVEDHFDERYGVLDAFDHPTWHRKILRRPNDDRWTTWQWSYFANVDGVDGGVDLNVMRDDDRSDGNES